MGYIRCCAYVFVATLYVLNLVLSILFRTFVSTMINYRTMVIYAIQVGNGVETSYDLSVIERKAKKYAKQRKTATITENGNEIGWVGEDLTQRKGWGWYIKK